MVIVSDSSPLIYLSWIGRLNLLKELFTEVVVPPTVYHEVAIAGETLPGSLEIRQSEWIQVKIPTKKKLPASVVMYLDEGESEAIELALELQAEYLLIDEFKGREVAKDYGVIVVGVLGILLKSKEKKLIPSVKEEIQKLINDTNFRVSTRVIEEVLLLAGEE